jgi:hypothetical protein
MGSRLTATNGQGWRALLARRIAVRDGPEMITLAGARWLNAKGVLYLDCSDEPRTDDAPAALPVA